MDVLANSRVFGPNTQIIFGIESNFGGQSRSADLYVSMTTWAMRRGITIHGASNDNRNSGRRPGIWLNQVDKEAMALRTRKLLDGKQLQFAQELCTTQDPNAMIDKLIHQCGNYCRKFRDGGLSEGSGRGNGYSAVLDSRHPFIYTGKAAGENDDLCIAFQEGVGLMDSILKLYPTVISTIPQETDTGVNVEFSDNWVHQQLRDHNIRRPARHYATEAETAPPSATGRRTRRRRMADAAAVAMEEVADGDADMDADAARRRGY